MAEAELTTIARPYARAVFKTAVDQDRLAYWSETLRVLSGVSRDVKIREALASPSLTQNRRAELLIGICGDQLDDYARNFLGILADYQRIGALPEIHKLFELLKANHEKTVEVEVISAYEVSDEDSARLAEILQGKLKRNVNILARVDPSLMGGLIVKTEDSVIDHTVRGKLGKLTQAMNA